MKFLFHAILLLMVFSSIILQKGVKSNEYQLSNTDEKKYALFGEKDQYLIISLTQNKSKQVFGTYQIGDCLITAPDQTCTLKMESEKTRFIVKCQSQSCNYMINNDIQKKTFLKDSLTLQFQKTKFQHFVFKYDSSTTIQRRVFEFSFTDKSMLPVYQVSIENIVYNDVLIKKNQVILNLNQKLTCDECSVTVYSKGSKSFYVNLFQYEQATPITANIPYMDVTSDQNDNVYKIKIAKEKYFKIQVTFSVPKKTYPNGSILATLNDDAPGAKEVYDKQNWGYEFDSDNIIEEVEDIEMNRDRHQYNVLVSTESQVNFLNPNFASKTLTIVVTSEMPLTFKLIVTSRIGDTPIVEFQETINGQLQCGTFQNLKFIIDKNQYKNVENEVVMMKMVTDQQDSKAIVASNYCENSMCTHISEFNFHKYAEKQNQNEIESYSVTKQILNINCETKTSSQCIYMVGLGLEGNCDRNKKVLYDFQILHNDQITAKDIVENNIEVKNDKDKPFVDNGNVLTLNTPFYSVINWQESQKFTLTLNEKQYKERQTLTFITAPNIQIYVTQDQKCQHKRCCKNQGNPLVLSKKQIQKDKSFTIFTYADEYQEYHLTADMQTKDSIWAIGLQSNQKVTSYLSNLPRYFKLNTQGGTNDIVVQGTDLIIMVNKGKNFTASKKNKPDCISYNEHLSISKKSKCYNPKGIYSITITYSDKKLYSDILKVFTIIAVDKNSITKLHLNEVYNDFVKDKKTYEINFDPIEQNIYIDTKPLNNCQQVDVYIDKDVKDQDLGNQVQVKDGFVGAENILKLCNIKLDNLNEVIDNENDSTQSDAEGISAQEEINAFTQSDEQKEKKKEKKKDKKNSKKSKKNSRRKLKSIKSSKNHQRKKKEKKQKKHQKCTLFITVVNKEKKTDSSFTISAQSHQTTIQLREGVPIKSAFDVSTQEINYYFIPRNNKSLYFQLESFTFTVKADFMIFKNDKNLVSFQYPFNQIKNANSNDNNQNFEINSSLFNQCWPNCVILIKVQKGSNSKEEQHEDYMFVQGTYFTIQINSENEYINNDTQKFFNLDSSSKFFFYSLQKTLSAKEDIIISLTTFTGQVSIFSRIYEHEKIINRQFHDDEATFESFSNFLEIPFDKIKEKAKDMKEPYCVIQIEAEKFAKVQLAIMTSKSRYIQVLHGLPLNFALDQSSQTSVTFRYYHYKKSKFQIRINKVKGILSEVEMFVTKKQNFGDSDKSTIKFQQSNNILTAFVDDYKRNYNYFIRVNENAISSEFQIRVILEDEPIMLQEQQVYKDSLNDNYLLYKLSPHKKELNVQIDTYNGKVNVYQFTKYKKFQKIQDWIKNGSMVKNQVSNAHNKDKLINFTVEPVKKNKNKQLVESFVYILVSNPSPIQTADFGIQYSSGSSFLTIADGQMKYINMAPKSKSYLLYNHLAHFNTTMSMQVTYINDLKNGINHKENTLEVEHKEGEDYKNKMVQVAGMSKNIQNYEIRSVNGTYKMIFENKRKDAQLLQVLIQANDLILAPLNQDLVQLQFVRNELKFFQFHMPADGLAHVYMKQCQGEYKVMMTQNQRKIQKIYEEQKIGMKAIFKTGSYLDEIKVKKGSFYLVLQNLDKGDTYLTLNVKHYKKGAKIPLINLEVGDSGQIQVKKVLGSNLQIIFNPVVCKKCSKSQLKKMKINYRLIYSQNQEQFNIFGRCRANQFYEVKKGSSVKEILIGPEFLTQQGYYLYNFQEPRTNKFYMTIVAEVVSSPKVMDSHDIFYNYEYYDKEILHTLTFMQVIGYFVTLLFVAALCSMTLYYMRKAKRAKSQLFLVQQGQKRIGESNEDGENLMNRSSRPNVIRYEKAETADKDEELQDGLLN